MSQAFSLFCESGQSMAMVLLFGSTMSTFRALSQFEE